MAKDVAKNYYYWWHQDVGIDMEQVTKWEDLDPIERFGWAESESFLGWHKSQSLTQPEGNEVQQMTPEQSPKFAFTYSRTHMRRFTSTGASSVVAKAEITVFAANEDKALLRAEEASATLEQNDFYVFNIKTISEVL